MNNPFPSTDEVLEKSKKALPQEILSFIEKCLKEPHSESQLIAILQKTQTHFGYLTEDAMNAIAQLMQIPTAHVTGVATFYHLFRLKKSGRFIISVCTGTACHVRGSDVLAKKLKEELGIDFGETTNDQLFTLESTRCLGMCALSPVIKIGEDVYAQVTPDQIPSILERYFSKK
jgi:NADH:ubiquinone oxidoreductase subunit E